MPSARLSLTLALAAAACAQDESRGPTFEAKLDGTANELGLIMRFDATAGYRLNRYAAVEAGVPVYYVKPSEAALPVLGAASGSALGNAHLALRLSFAQPSVSYEPSLTVTAPTGDETRGLSTGEVTWDFRHLLYRTFGRVTPYGAFGIANTVADTPFFVRPFTSQGLVGHFEGGTLVALGGPVSVGGSLYAIQPSGEQTVVSRVVRQQPAAARGRAKRGVFEEQPNVEGPAEIARDRGGSLWITLAAKRGLSFHAGYSRSATFALDTAFFGMAVKFGK